MGNRAGQASDAKAAVESFYKNVEALHPDDELRDAISRARRRTRTLGVKSRGIKPA